MSEAAYIPLLGNLGYEACHGHLDRETARALVHAETGWPKKEQQFFMKHAFARFVPSQGEEHDVEFLLSSPGRGAFPVTLLSDSRFADKKNG